MATPIGVDTITALSRRHIMPDIHDVIYSDNPLTFRLLRGNKRVIQGGNQIEVPLMYKRTGVGGVYRGYDVYNVSPADTIKNAAHDWKQLVVPVAIDGLTIIKSDSPESIANLVTVGFKQADMEMAEHLADGIWSAGTNAKQITGLQAIVDDGTVAASYGGITRSSNVWWKSQCDFTTGTMTTVFLNSLMGSATVGSKSPTIIISRRDQYNRYWGLVQTKQEFPVMAGGHDEQLASAGFTNLLFNNVPWTVDSHVPDGTGSSNSQLFMLNEEFFDLAVSPHADFRLDDFQMPPNQDAMVSSLKWAGELICSNTALQAKATDLDTV